MVNSELFKEQGVDGKIRKVFRMKTRRMLNLSQRLNIPLVIRRMERQDTHQTVGVAQTTTNNNNTTSRTIHSLNANTLNASNFLNLIGPLLSQSISFVYNNNSVQVDFHQLILAALLDLKMNSTLAPNVGTNSSVDNDNTFATQCQCINCHIHLYIKATVTKVFENLLMAKEMEECKTALVMNAEEKEQISKDLLESEEFVERIRQFQSSSNTTNSLIQVESIVKNGKELFVMISDVIPQQRSVYIASFDILPNK